MATLDPNRAYRDRDKKPNKPIVEIHFKTAHNVIFTSPNCDHQYTAVVHAGMTLYGNNLRCPVCTDADMDYHIDP